MILCIVLLPNDWPRGHECAGVQVCSGVSVFQCYVLFSIVRKNVLIRNSVSFNTKTFMSQFCFFLLLH